VERVLGIASRGYRKILRNPIARDSARLRQPWRTDYATGVTPKSNASLDASVIEWPFRSHEAIVNPATERGVDLIVLVRRGMNALREIIVGSTSEQAAVHSNCAVLIVQGSICLSCRDS
jgi:nucleotide-binding universal stress UspA family protein